MATVNNDGTIQTEEEGLESNLAKCGIQAKCVNWVQAPQMFRFTFETYGTPTVSQIKKAIEKIRVHFGDYQYAETPNGKGFAIIRPLAKPNPVWATNAEDELLKVMAKDSDAKQKCYICFGKDENNEYVFDNLDNCKSMLVAGTAGSGKSCFLNSLIIYLHVYSNADIMLIDPKNGAEFALYEDDVYNRFYPIAKNTNDALRYLRYAFKVMQDRFTEMGEARQKKYNGNRLIIIIDELAELMEENSDEIVPIIRRIAAKGRAAGVHIIAATQNPLVSVVPSLMKSNLQTRICLKTSDTRQSMNIIDCGKGATLLGRGDAYIKFEDKPNLIRVQTPYIPDDMIEEIITGKRSDE